MRRCMKKRSLRSVAENENKKGMLPVEASIRQEDSPPQSQRKRRCRAAQRHLSITVEWHYRRGARLLQCDSRIGGLPCRFEKVGWRCHHSAIPCQATKLHTWSPARSRVNRMLGLCCRISCLCLACLYRAVSRVDRRSKRRFHCLGAAEMFFGPGCMRHIPVPLFDKLRMWFRPFDPIPIQTLSPPSHQFQLAVTIVQQPVDMSVKKTTRRKRADHGRDRRHVDRILTPQV